MLTPAEELGLSGSSLAGRVRKAFYTIPEPRVAELIQRIRDEGFHRHLIYLRENEPDAIRVLPWRPTSGEAHPDQPGGPTVAPAVRSRPNHFNEAQFGPGGSACQWGSVRATRHSAVLRYLSTVGLSRWTSSSRGRETRTGTAMMYRPIAAPSRCEAARVTPRRISSGILDPLSFPK